MSREVWMPHAGHFICANHCRFHLNTYVNGYIISTVGEYVPDSAVRKIARETRGRPTDLQGDAEEDEFGFEQLGNNRTYETMVFKARKSDYRCCPYEMAVPNELDFQGYLDSGAAYKGHLAMVKKWQKKP